MFFILSDIHGCFNELIKALNHWDKENEHLIVLGDLVDRGPDTLKVVQHLMQLQIKNPDNVTVLKGNHDASLANWLIDTPYELLTDYYIESHRESLLSFYGGDHKQFKKATRKQRAINARYRYKYELFYLQQLPHYFETDNIIFVHAGINLTIDDWCKDKNAMLDIRNTFYHSSTPAPKRVFFGHTPTSLIRNSDNHDIWISPNGDKVGIDGGISMGGQLNALRIDSSGDITETIVIKEGEES